MPELVIRNLRKTFGDTVILHDLSLEIAPGEFFTLLGPSGCGKSTTLNCIAGLERPEAGSITVDGTSFVDERTFLPTEARNLGMVFQSYALWPHRTVAENLAMPLRIRKVGRAERDRLIDEALDKVGLAHLRDRYPHQLSGGQQQRVALARALVYSPTVLLLDEPLSNLDAKLRDQARTWLKRLQEELGITTVYVTHDQQEALALSDRIAVMSAGRLLQVGTPEEIYETPASVEVADFVGRCNLLAARVQDVGDGTCTVTLGCDGTSLRVTTDTAPGVGEQVSVMIRPERTRLTRPDEHVQNTVTARVLQSSYVGARWELQLVVGDHLLRAESATPVRAELVDIHLPPDACALYREPAATDPEAGELIDATR